MRLQGRLGLPGCCQAAGRRGVAEQRPGRDQYTGLDVGSFYHGVLPEKEMGRWPAALLLVRPTIRESRRSGNDPTRLPSLQTRIASRLHCPALTQAMGCVRHTDAFSVVAYGDGVARPALMLPHLACIGTDPTIDP